MYLPRKGGGGIMELNRVHRATNVGLSEYVKSSTDSGKQFVHKHEHKPENVSLTHLANNLPKTGVNSRCHAPNRNGNKYSPNDCKKGKRKIQHEIPTDIQ